MSLGYSEHTFTYLNGGNKLDIEELVPPIISIGSCFLLSIIYIASLYVWCAEHDRDHPSTVKKRFFSVTVVMLISPIFLYLFSSKNLFERITIWEAMGFRFKGLLQAIIIPFLLTVLLFLGPLSVNILMEGWRAYVDPFHWLIRVKNILWLRNHLVAPLSEEFTFRACMVPLLLQSFSPLKTVLITPLFFGVAHFHHIVERLRRGMELKTIIIISCFQFMYTTVFGFYSAYLFIRTGHFVAPFMAHAFCNHMGFPDISELLGLEGTKRKIFIGLYIIGLIGWILLIPFATNPSWYSNNIYYDIS